MDLNVFLIKVSVKFLGHHYPFESFPEFIKISNHIIAGFWFNDAAKCKREVKIKYNASKKSPENAFFKR